MKEDFSDAFRRKAVLVTGANGFLGAHLTERLVAWGADVHVFIRQAARAHLAALTPCLGHIQIHWGDLLDPQAVNRAVAALEGKDAVAVFHLAAQSHVNASAVRSMETVLSNVVGTLNLLQALVDRRIHLLKVSLAASSEEYGQVLIECQDHYEFDTRGNLLLNERTPLNPKSIYATSKASSNLLGLNYHSTYGVPVVITRLVNNYGPGQHPRHITGRVIAQALQTEMVNIPLVPWKRDFLYVDDGVRAHVHSVLFGKPGETYVYGQGQNIAITDWAQLILDRGEKGRAWTRRLLRPSSEQRRTVRSDIPATVADTRKINSLSGWKPLCTWEEGLHRTIRWYAEHAMQWKELLMTDEAELRNAAVRGGGCVEHPL